MFTGIVRERAKVASFDRGRLVVESSLDPTVGDSVAVDGVCLTVAERTNGSLAFDVMPETLQRAKPFGTEVNLVNRLQQRFPDKEIHLLAPDLCMCATMYRIAPQNLAWAMDNLVDGVVVNEIVVDDETKHYAHVALDRMISLTETKR